METIVTFGQLFFGWLLQTTLIASVVICLILLIQKTLGSRLGPRWCHALWLVLVIRMVMPWAPSSRLSLSNLIPTLDRPIQRQQPMESAEQKKVSAPEQTAETPEAIPGQEPESEIDIQTSFAPKPPAITNVEGESKPRLASLRRVLPILWLAGAVVIGAYLLVSNFALWRIVKRDRPLINQAMLELFEECKARIGVQTLVVVVPSDRIKSPALFGFIRPRLLLPSDMLEKASEEEMQYVFLHELAHLKRHDIYFGWLTSLLQVLHWFNPLVWFAFYRMRSDREFACDALVLTKMGQEKSHEYGGAIVGLLRRFSRSRPLPAMAGILENKSQLKRRMTMIARFKKNSYQWSPLAVTSIFILACVSLPDAKHIKASGIQKAQPAPHISIRRVWSGPLVVELFGEPSPDGRYLSYVDWETGDLAIYEVATGKKRRLTNKGTWDESSESAAYSRWSPDGTQIAYCWERGKDSVDLRVIRLDGSEPRTLYSTGEQTRWIEPCAWFPDGKQILVHLTGKDGTDQIVQISAADRSLRVLKTVGKDCLGYVRFSPDGKYIAYDFTQEDKNSLNRDITLISIDGGREIPLVEHPAVDFVLGWAPDGKNILFASDRTGTLGLWLTAVTGGESQGIPQMVKPIVGGFEPLGFTQKGSFYYGISKGNEDVYVATLDPETGKILIPPEKAVKRFEGLNFACDYSPDGKYLAYIYRSGILSLRHSDKILCIRSLETGKEREFPLILRDIRSYSSPRWSPDGRSLLINGVENNSSTIYKIDTQAGDQTCIIERGHSGEWSHDGKAILYLGGNLKLKVKQIVMHDLETGNEKEIHRFASDENVPFNMSLSPDGQWLALRCIRPTSLKILPVAGGEPRNLPEFEKVASVHKPIAWTADSQYILFSGNESGGGKHPLYRISRESGKAEKLGLQMNRYYGLSAHPNGRDILVSGRESAPESEVWVMENFLPEMPVSKPAPMTTVRRVEGDWGTFASLSPDGKYMCDVDWNTETLAVLELATGKVRHLTSKSSDGAYPLDSAISPDSKEVAYLWWNPKTKASSLHIVGLDGSSRRILRKGGYPMPRDWSTDGKKILAVVSENDVQQMVWVSASDGSIQHIASESLGYPGKFDISPDGLFIAYDRPQDEDTSKRDIFVFDLSENRKVSLVKHPANDKLLGWTPDGKHVLFASNRTGSWDAWLQQIADGRPQGFPELAKHGIGDVRPMGFTPQGSYYYGHEQILNDVFMARLDLETGEVLSEPVPVRQTGATSCHDWSPDGLYLAYCEQRRDESRAIHIRTLATNQERTLSDNIPYIRWLRWSPDSRSILIDGYKRGDSQGVISKIDVQTDERSDIVRSTTEVLVRPEMSPDGKTLFYERGDPDSKTGRLVARDMESGREKDLLQVVPPVRVTGSALSPDGQWFVLSIINIATRPATPVLKILSTTGGEPRELLQFDKSEKLRAVGVTWMPDSQNVLFWKRFQGDKELELWRISAEGGEPRKLCSRKAFGHMRVHPDGQHIAFIGRSTTRGVWVMENFLPTAVATLDN